MMGIGMDRGGMKALISTMKTLIGGAKTTSIATAGMRGAILAAADMMAGIVVAVMVAVTADVNRRNR
jgi:hypothetical protein